jgi:uncharacterized protein DUF3383
MTTIPASELVAVNPSVLGVGGAALDVIGLLLTSSTKIPIGAVQSFPDAASVGDLFGVNSAEDSFASVYFQGFEGSARKPGSILMAQYNTAAVAAWVRGATLGLTLAQVQALNAALSITIDGVLKSATIDLAAATSFSNAGVLIADALGIQGTQAAAFTGSITATTLTVSAVSSGALAVGQVIAGAGVTAGTYITALGTGTGGTGTYAVSDSQSVGSEGMTSFNPAVTYDSILGAFQINSGTTGAASTITYGSGALATSLKLTQATGAIISQGANAATPSAFMDAVVQVTTDWVTFATLFDPDVSGSANKQLFAAWKNAQNDRYAYVCWDLDQSPVTSSSASSSLGAILAANGDSGTCLLDGDALAGWNATSAPLLAAFVMGAAASIDFTERAGRISFAYKSQAGLVATVTTASAAQNLGGSPQSSNRGNGYNFYGAYAQANNSFVWFQRGFVTGDFLWLDSYIDQIWLNNALQAALLTLLEGARAIPYNAAGSSLIEAALADPIAAGLNFQAFAPGAISASQQAAVNASAGKSVAGTLQTQGYYLQIGQADAQTRAARGSPPCKFWYLDRGSVQAITLNSVAVT